MTHRPPTAPSARALAPLPPRAPASPGGSCSARILRPRPAGTGRTRRLRGRGAVVALAAAVHAASPGSGAAQGGPGAMELPASAEAGEARRSRAWMSFGLAGAALPEDVHAGLGVLAALTYQRGPHHASLRGMGFLDAVSGYADNVGELAALYGRTRTGALGHAAAAAGLAVVTVDRGSPQGVRRTVGLPLTAQAALHLWAVGLGIQVHANLNPEASFAGVGVFLQLGWMPP